MNKRMNHSPLIVSIEGNIGAGKSTILNHLKECLGDKVAFVPEPVDTWNTICSENGETILSKFYAEPQKYSFPFQIMAYSTRMAILKKTIDENPNCLVFVCERSLEADRKVFAKMLYDDNMMEPICFQIYEKLYQDTHSQYSLNGIIYMNTEPAKCIERIEKRGREGEQNINIDYLNKCKQYYDSWILHETQRKILFIESSKEASYNSIHDQGNLWIKEIKNYINELIGSK